MWLENILGTIGNTPMIELHKTSKGLPCKVLAKVEYFNPGNSIKDRMALTMIEAAEADGSLKPGGTIIEGTSGNTGMGLAMAAIIKGYRCIFTTTDKQSKEKVDILKALGAEVIVCPTNVEPEDPQSYYSVSRRLAQETPNSYYVNQYDNLANRQAHYEQTAPEIWEQTEGKLTHVVIASGTGGTVSGIGKFMKEKNPNIQVWAVDSYGSLLTKYFRTGELDPKEVYPYITEGIGEDFIPKNYDMSCIDYFEQVTDKDAAVMARRIAKEEGIFVGYSAGSALQAVHQLKSKLTKDDLVVVIFHDHGSRYVGKIYNDEWMHERGFLEVKTLRDVINGRKENKLISVDKNSTVAHAVEMMKKYDIENIPVKDHTAIIGSISESGLFQKIFSNPELKTATVEQVMEKPYTVVDLDLPIEKTSSLISRENTALLAKDDVGNYHIITKFDLIQSFAK